MIDFVNFTDLDISPIHNFYCNGAGDLEHYGPQTLIELFYCNGTLWTADTLFHQDAKNIEITNPDHCQDLHQAGNTE